MNFNVNLTNALNSKTDKNAAENIVYVLSSGNYRLRQFWQVTSRDIFLKL